MGKGQLILDGEEVKERKGLSVSGKNGQVQEKRKCRKV